jgi:hypothetical protein
MVQLSIATLLFRDILKTGEACQLAGGQLNV